MSNAMRSGKRALAGVAAGALALGMLSIAGASSASAGKAKPQVTPGTTSASVGPVRYTDNGASTPVQDPVYTSPLLFLAAGTDDSTLTNDDTIVFKVTSAPSTAAKVWLNQTPLVIPTDGTSADDTLSTATGDDTTADVDLGSLGWGVVAGTGGGDDSVISTSIGVSGNGVFAGTIKIYDGSGTMADPPTQTVTWGFRTAGAPVSATVDPTSLSLSASTAPAAAGTVTVSLADSAGNPTQMGASNGDAIGLTSASTTIASVSPAALTAASFDDSTADVLGTATFSVQPTATAGSTTVTATPAGTLPTGGVTAQTVSVTTTTGGTTPPTALTMTAPTSNYIDDTNTDDTKGYTLNSSAVFAATVTGTGASASATQSVTIATTGSWTGLTVAGNAITSSSQVVLVGADADGKILLPMSWTGAGTRITVTSGSGSLSKWVVMDMAASSSDNSVTPSGSIVQKVGEATSYEVTLGDQFGNPLAGYLVSGKAGTGSYGSAVATGSDGKATISVPAPSATYLGSATVAFRILTSGGGSTSETIPGSNSITYTSTGNITSMSVSVNGGAATTLTSPTAATVLKVAAANTPAIDGTVGSGESSGYYTLPTSTAAGALTVGNGASVATFAVTTVPANASVVTVPEGLKVSATAPTSSTMYSGGASSATIASGSKAYIWGTKTGSHEITIESGGQTITGTVVIYNTFTDSYNMDLSPAEQTIGAGSISTVTLTVTDMFGNGVETRDDTGAVKITASGEVLLAGYLASNTYTTDENGKATVTIIGGNAGAGALAASVPTGSQAAAWATGYTPPTGMAAPKTSAAAAVVVTSSSTKSITIVGQRGTVKGKPGVMVDGLTSGFAEGDLVVPYVKFPGQTSYSAGTSRPAIDADGEFYWQRKTGKKIYIFFKNEDGSVKSDRIIIQAK